MSAIAADDRGSGTNADGRGSEVAATESGNVDRSNNEKNTNDRGSGTAVQGRSSAVTNAANSGSSVRDGTPTDEYSNECAWRLANGKHVETHCSVNMTGEDGKTYCFSNDKAMTAFMIANYGDHMNRLLRIFIAGAIAAALSGMTWAADQSTSQQSSQTEPPASDKPTTGPSNKSNKAEEDKGKDAYEAKLKKCDNVAADVAGKQQCIEKVQKDKGQM